MNTVRLEFSQFGHFESFDVFRHSEPMLVDSLPEPVATGLKTMFYVDANVADGDNYYRVRVNRDEGSLVSDEIYIRVINEWSPDKLTTIVFFGDASTAVLEGGKVSELRSLIPSTVTFTQGTLDARPSLVGKAISFDGVDDSLRTGLTSLLSDVNLAWAFIIYLKRTANVTDASGALLLYSPITMLPTEVPNRFNLLALRYSTRKIAFASRPLESSANTVLESSKTPVGVLTRVYTVSDYLRGSSRLEVNGSVDGDGVMSPLLNSDPKQSEIFLASGVAAGYSDIDLYCAVIGTGSEPSKIDKLKLDGWCAHAYGVTNTLPDNHPYKWVKPIIVEDNKPYVGEIITSVWGSPDIRLGVSGVFDECYSYTYQTSKTHHQLMVDDRKPLNTLRYLNTAAIEHNFMRVEVVKEGISYFSEEVEYDGTPLSAFLMYSVFNDSIVDLKGIPYTVMGQAAVVDGALRLPNPNTTHRDYLLFPDNALDRLFSDQDFSIRIKASFDVFSSSHYHVLFALRNYSQGAGFILSMGNKGLSFNFHSGSTTRTLDYNSQALEVEVGDVVEISVERKGLKYYIYFKNVLIHSTGVISSLIYKPSYTILGGFTLGTMPDDDRYFLKGAILGFNVVDRAVGGGGPTTPMF